MRKNRLTALILFLSTIVYGKEIPLDEMIGEMIMVGFEGTTKQSKWVKQISSDIARKKVGGVLLFEKNIDSPKQLKSLTSFLSSSNRKNPPLIAIDQEGGQVSRLSRKKGFNVYPSANYVGKNMSLEEASSLYKKMAKELKDYGINYNLAPVVDVTSEFSNFQKKRTFYKYPSIVSSYAQSFIDAFESENVLTSLKHFPGYGSAPSDTHKKTVNTTSSWNYSELMPFFNLIESKSATSIMVGHTYLKKFDLNYPASLSYEIVTNVLRKNMGYKGVIISDDMFMKGVGDKYDMQDRIILSINAGVNILIFSKYFLFGKSTPTSVSKIIKEAIEQGKIDKNQIKYSYEKIIQMKSLLK